MQEDLGDDLLQAPSPSDRHETVEDPLRRAKILESEGFLSDARKAYQRILLDSPTQKDIQESLLRIEKLELQQLKSERGASGEDWQSLKLELQRRYGDPGSSPPEWAKSLQKELFDQLKQVSAPIEEYLDLAIFFTQLGWYSVALEGLNQVHFQVPENLVVIGLKVQVWIEQEKWHEAISEILPVLQDSSVKPADRVPFYYWMGFVYEKLEQKEISQAYFRAVKGLEPQYRDVQFRVR